MLGLEQFLDALAPKGGGERTMYSIDLACLSIAILNMESLKEVLGVYILGITAVSITVTLIVKIYNILHPHKQDVVMGTDDE